jgi:hypothetical protein
MLVLAACGGAGAAWLGIRWLGGAGSPETAAEPLREAAVVPVPSGGQPAATSPTSGVRNTEAQPHRTVEGPPNQSATSVANEAKLLAVGEGTLNESPAARSKILNRLLSSSSLSCDISAAQGAMWSGGTALVHSISYQGGPFAYQAINLEAGTATMTGSAGVTGSADGELAVKVTPTDGGLNFTGFTRSGDLLIVTVYAALDAAGHYRTVMSRHGSRMDNESAQFYGTCDTFLTQQ